MRKHANLLSTEKACTVTEKNYKTGTQRHTHFHLNGAHFAWWQNHTISVTAYGFGVHVAQAHRCLRKSCSKLNVFRENKEM